MLDNAVAPTVTKMVAVGLIHIAKCVAVGMDDVGHRPATLEANDLRLFEVINVLVCPRIEVSLADNVVQKAIRPEHVEGCQQCQLGWASQAPQYPHASTGTQLCFLCWCLTTSHKLLD